MSLYDIYLLKRLCPGAQALVDRPDMVRKQMNFKRLVLTDFKIDIPRLAKKKVLTAALEESGACRVVPLLHCNTGLALSWSQQTVNMGVIWSASVCKVWLSSVLYTCSYKLSLSWSQQTVNMGVIWSASVCKVWLSSVLYTCSY